MKKTLWSPWFIQNNSAFQELNKFQFVILTSMIFFTGKLTVEYTLKAEMVETGGDKFFCKTHVDTAGEDTDAAKLINSQGAYCCAKSKNRILPLALQSSLRVGIFLMFFH